MQVVYLPAVMKIALAVLIFALALDSPALDTAALVDGPTAELLEKNCIRTDIGGVLPVRFETAVALLNQPDLILHIQEEYRLSVSKDGTSDFPIIATGDGAYHYINEKGQRTDFFELYREQTSETAFDLIYLAHGKRYFGKYEVLIHVRAVNAEAAGTLYIAEIHAYPRNAALRFFARRFGTAEHYFQRKTRLVAHVSIQLCLEMENAPTFVYQPSPPSWSHD